MRDRNGDDLAFATDRQRQVVEEITGDGSGCYAEPPLSNGTIEIRCGGFHQGFVLADGTYV